VLPGPAGGEAERPSPCLAQWQVAGQRQKALGRFENGECDGSRFASELSLQREFSAGGFGERRPAARCRTRR
jgi:hypothetical protein